ncbi:MAG: 50S ribosomal protein L19 [Patescibacteria group bacterium]
MSHHLIKNSSVIQQQLRTDIPAFSSGSVVEVFYKIVEGNKERIQSFKGICVAKKHGSTTLDGTFTVLKVASGSIKVKRTFPIHSPLIDKVIVHTYNRARRSKLYYLEGVKDPIKSVRTKAVKAK